VENNHPKATLIVGGQAAQMFKFNQPKGCKDVLIINKGRAVYG